MPYTAGYINVLVHSHQTAHCADSYLQEPYRAGARARRWLTDWRRTWAVSSLWWASRRWQGWYTRVAIYFKWNGDGNYSGTAMAFLHTGSWLTSSVRVAVRL